MQALNEGSKADSPETAAPGGLCSPETAGELAYICEIVGELRDLADGAGYDLLAYLLDMAHDEARQKSGLAGPVPRDLSSA